MWPATRVYILHMVMLQALVSGFILNLKHMKKTRGWVLSACCILIDLVPSLHLAMDFLRQKTVWVAELGRCGSRSFWCGRICSFYFCVLKSIPTFKGAGWCRIGIESEKAIVRFPLLLLLCFRLTVSATHLLNSENMVLSHRAVMRTNEICFPNSKQ